MNATIIETSFPGAVANAPAGTLPHAASPGAGPSRRALWCGRTLSGLFILFGTMDAAVKVLTLPPAVEGTVRLGYPVNTIFGIGLAALACLILYVIPRTAIIGAVLWTGYLGGAVASNVRIGSPLFTNALFPIYVAVFLWAGLWLRDRRVSALFASLQ